MTREEIRKEYASDGRLARALKVCRVEGVNQRGKKASDRDVIELLLYQPYLTHRVLTIDWEELDYLLGI